MHARRGIPGCGCQVIFRTPEQPLSGRNQTILQVSPSRGEYNRICSTGQPLTGRTLPYILHGSTPLGEENLAGVQRGNLLKRIQFRCCFLGATPLEDLATQPRSPKQPPSGNVKSYLTPEATLLSGNTVMGYSLRQPSNEGNACYDGFLGHPRKRGEHAACTLFQMHPQWGHESLHLQMEHPSYEGIPKLAPHSFKKNKNNPAYCEEYKTDTRSPSSIEPPPH